MKNIRALALNKAIEFVTIPTLTTRAVAANRNNIEEKSDNLTFQLTRYANLWNPAENIH